MILIMHMVEIERILVEAGNSVQLVVQVIIFLNRKAIRPGSNKSGMFLSRHFFREIIVYRDDIWR